MSIKTLHIDIVSAEKAIYSGEATQVIVTSGAGELGIMPGHTALLSSLKPGEIRVLQEGKQELFFVSGGMLEVQPHIVTILADTVERAHDLDEMIALEAKERAEKAMADRKDDVDYARASAELAEAMAQLRVISKMRDQLGIK
jgi:F-type H+-transporting ATPase subunit epsilon